MNKNLCVKLKRRPQGTPVVQDFELREADVSADGVLCRARYISLDPYIRGRLSGRHLSGPIAPGEAISSEMLFEVLEASHGFAQGDLVRGFGPWQHLVRLSASGLQRISENLVPPSLALGVLGMPGLTAFAGVRRLLKPEQGEVLLVSAAAGPVGATVAQLGRLAGARTIGIAGSDEKCGWLERNAGLDGVINYKREALREGLDRECPNGIDMYFDNVGGDVLEAAMERLAVGARVALCGLMAQYNSDAPPPGPNPGLIIKARASVHGLVVYDHEDLRADMEREVSQAIADGDLVYKEDVSEGLEAAAEGFCRLMRGENFGKALVRVV